MWLIVAAFVLYVLFSVQAIGEPGLYMDAVNPDYQVVRMLNPQSPTAIYELPGNMLFGRLPVLGSLYHGSYTTYVTLPFYVLLGGTMVSIRLAHLALGLFVLVAAGLLLWETTRSGIVTGIGLLALAVDPTFFLLFRTQAYLPLFPVFLVLLSLYVIHRRPAARGYFGAGVLLGLAAFGYFVYLFALPGIVLFVYYDSKREGRKRALAMVAAGIVAGMLPYALGYALIFGELGVRLGAASIDSYVHTLNVVTNESFTQRVLYIIAQTWYVVTGRWEWLTFWALNRVDVVGLLKACVLVGLPICVLAFLRRPYPFGRGFALAGLTVLSFALFATVFGGRLGGHDLAAVVPMLYVLATIAALALVAAARRQNVTRLAAAGGVVLCVLNAATGLAMTQRLATYGGTAFYSDIISDAPREAALRGDTSPYVFASWGGMMPFIYLTDGRIPVFDADHLQEALCTYGSANVVLLGGDASASPQWSGARATASVTQHDARSGFAYEIVSVRPSGPRCGVPTLPVGQHLPPGVDERAFATTTGVYPSVPAMCCFLDHDAAFTVMLPTGTRWLTLDVFVPGYAFYGTQRLQIRLSGSLVATTPALRKGADTLVRVPVPTGTSGATRVTISATYAYVPKETGIGPDPNRYSVILKSVVASASEPTPAPAVASATPTPLPATLALPQGIARADAQTVQGIYPGDPSTCCFIGSRASFTVRVPRSAHWLTLNVYVPDYAFYGKQQLTIEMDGIRVLRTDALETGATTAISVPLSTPEAQRGSVRVVILPSFTYVPRNVGLNDDARRLSVILSSLTSRN